jgi:hypothetical protein
MRCDSTVVETGILWPSDAGLSLEAVRALAREGRRVAALAGKGAKRVQDRSRAVAERLRLIGRTLARRRGEKRAEVLRLTGEAGELLRRSIREARALAGRAREQRGRAAQANLAAAGGLNEFSRLRREGRPVRSTSAWPASGSAIAWLVADADARPQRASRRLR